MFDRSTWRMQVGRKLDGFARNPRQEIVISSGPVMLLTYLASVTLEPFLNAFEEEPITAIQTLASISAASEMNAVVRRAPSTRYRLPHLLEYELRHSTQWRSAIEQLLVGVDTVQLARQRLHGLDSDWFIDTLRKEIIDLSPTEFLELHRRLNDSLKSFYGIFQEMRQRKGAYTQEELILIYVGLSDSSAAVRAQAARRLGEYAWSPSENMVNRLIQIALYDNDLESRNAAARAIGALKDRIHTPAILEVLSARLRDQDRFVRTATAMLLSHLGELAGTTSMVEGLVQLLHDPDSYAREAAAHALGTMGVNATAPSVISALAQALQDDNEHVHDAALDSLTHLRELRDVQTTVTPRTTTPISPAAPAKPHPEAPTAPEPRRHDDTSELLAPSLTR